MTHPPDWDQPTADQPGLLASRAAGPAASHVEGGRAAAWPAASHAEGEPAAAWPAASHAEGEPAASGPADGHHFGQSAPSWPAFGKSAGEVAAPGAAYGHTVGGAEAPGAVGHNARGAAAPSAFGNSPGAAPAPSTFSNSAGAAPAPSTFSNGGGERAASGRSAEDVAQPAAAYGHNVGEVAGSAPASRASYGHGVHGAAAPGAFGNSVGERAASGHNAEDVAPLGAAYGHNVGEVAGSAPASGASYGHGVHEAAAPSAFGNSAGEGAASGRSAGEATASRAASGHNAGEVAASEAALRHDFGEVAPFGDLVPTSPAGPGTLRPGVTAPANGLGIPAVNSPPAPASQAAATGPPAGYQPAATGPPAGYQPAAGNGTHATHPPAAGNASTPAGHPAPTATYGHAAATGTGSAPAVNYGHAPTGPPNTAEVSAFAEFVRRLAHNVESVVLGKPQVVRLALTALLAEGHVLLEDVPGVGKTTLARAVAASVQGQWRRIQFTPDLLPSDVTGVTIFNQGTRGFEFHPGPVFANIVIADEINRASPKTQSALLEVMEEQYVTVDGVRHAVPRPFLVVATQNPIEMDGTYRLPEAQLDRFLMKLTVGYPVEAVEIDVLKGAAAGRTPESLAPVTDTATVAALVQLAHRVHIADPLYAYAVRLAAATRVHGQVRVGVSPRGVIALTRAASAYALTDGRPYVIPEDLKALVEPVFAHRLLLSPDAQVRGIDPADVLREVLDTVPVPAPA